MSRTLDELQKAVGEWGVSTFPHSTVETIHLHLMREVDELGADLEKWDRQQRPVKSDVHWPTVVEELADCVLLMLHIAHRRRFSFGAVLEQKFAINQTREWGEPDAEGVSEHRR